MNFDCLIAQKIVFKCSTNASFILQFLKKFLPWEGGYHLPPLSRFAPSPRTSHKMCPLRDFAPPNLKVFRRAWSRSSYEDNSLKLCLTWPKCSQNRFGVPSSSKWPKICILGGTFFLFKIGQHRALNSGSDFTLETLGIKREYHSQLIEPI